MGIRETLQDALVEANNERHNRHGIVQNLDGRLIDLKANLQRAQTQKAGVGMLHEATELKYRELLNHSNGLTDQAARGALAPEIEKLSLEVNTMTGNLQHAGEVVWQWQRQVTQAETEHASAQINLEIATDRWEQIKKQIEDLNR